MTIEVHTYGDVTPSFRDLTAEIYENVAEDMSGFPPKCNLHVCKTKDDFVGIKRKINRRFLRISGLDPDAYHEKHVCFSNFQTIYLFECPDTLVLEDLVRPYLEYLEELEGNIAHEAGHASDLYKNNKNCARSDTTTLKTCVFLVKADYDAEKNAADAGYSSGLLARKYLTIREKIEDAKKERVNSRSFFNNLNMMVAEAAFMQSQRVPEQQRQSSERIWNKLAESRCNKVVRDLLQSRELKESPEKFGDERFLEDFIYQKHHGWGFSF